MGDVEILPAQRLMVACRKIKSVSGPVSLGSVSIFFDDYDACKEFVEALLETRGIRSAQDGQAQEGS